MIEINGVQPTAGELRPLLRGWGLIHWVACLPTVVLGLGLCAITLIAASWDPANDALADAVAVSLVFILILWAVSQRVVRGVMAKAQLSAPGTGLPCDWMIDDRGVSFATRLATSRFDWAAVKAVREERDRFVLLVSPSNNPVLPKRQTTDAQQAAFRELVGDVQASGRLGRGVD